MTKHGNILNSQRGILIMSVIATRRYLKTDDNDNCGVASNGSALQPEYKHLKFNRKCHFMCYFSLGNVR